MDVFSLDYFFSYLLSYIVVFLLACCVAAIELASTIPYKTKQVLLSKYSIYYMAINAVIGMLALFLLHVFGIEIGSQNAALHPTSVKVSEVLLVSFGSMMVLRSSVVKLGNTSVGPEQIINQLLTMVKDRVEIIQQGEYNQLVLEHAKSISRRQILEIIIPYCGHFSTKTDYEALHKIEIEHIERLDKTIDENEKTGSSLTSEFIWQREKAHNAILLHSIGEIIGWNYLEEAIKALMAFGNLTNGDDKSPPKVDSYDKSKRDELLKEKATNTNQEKAPEGSSENN
jgi:hypothetical protein